ncbi:MAG: PEP-CTERM sorting domain-containing protein [Planctomycetes bacterium]|nr:PEP-CTERM sorting domain-containing protein [Planctomycetota bacterium]
MAIHRSRFLLAVALCATTNAAYGIPSPIAHVHNAQTVSWKNDGSPALPWDDATADKWNHNHLTADPFDKFQTWLINKAWDDRTVHSSVAPLGPAQFGHGLIQSSMPVRYGGDSTVPGEAMDVIEAGYNSWVTKATTQFNAKKDPWDRLAINFQRANSGPTEISVVFVDSLTDAYAQFTAANQLQFVKKPQVSAATDAPNKRIRKKGEMTNTTSITFDTPWTYSGSPNRLPDIAIEFSDDSGTTWSDTAPAGFGDLTLIAGDANFTTPAASANPLFVFEMDFKTIALHEIGHSIALGHAGTGIMRANIAQYGSFGSTQDIDNDAALAVAIDYTYSVPEPTTFSMLLLGLACLPNRRRKFAPQLLLKSCLAPDASGRKRN